MRSEATFSAARAFERLAEYASFTPAPPGTAEHERLATFLAESLEAAGLSPELDRWTVRCSRSRRPNGEGEGVATLTNLAARVRGRQHGLDPVVFGTHWDTRWIADRERDAARRDVPIPGVNDGGSGTAVLLELARVLNAARPARDVLLVFFDGEDLGGLDGHPFCVGSRHFVSRLREPVAAAVVLDMVGGRDARYAVEGTTLTAGPESARLFGELFAAGRALGHPAFFDGAERWVTSDHVPFLRAGIPAALLIDIDYPEWHTLDDTLAACTPESLCAAGETLLAWLDEDVP
jgi:Zn-dependent M28 family amino/carboxypeptidase